MASSSSTGSPCAACRLTRRRCTQECVFAPHFPSDQPRKYLCVHKVFGASNVAKLLSELPFDQRDDAVTSLVFEAELQLKDPVYGSAGLVSYLQQHLKQVQDQLAKSREELATYVGPDQAMRPIIQTQQQQLFEAQQLAAVNAVTREQHELFRAYGGGGSNTQHHQNQPQVDISRFDDGYGSVPTGSVTVAGFNQLGSGGTTVTGMPPYVALGGNYVDDQQLHHQRHEQHGTQLFVPTQSSQPLPLQPQETRIFIATQSSQMLPPQTHETQMFMPTQSSHSIPHQTQERQMFTPPQSSQSLPFQPQETRIFMPTQSSQMLPPQTHETQMFMPTQSSYSLRHQTHETQMFTPPQSSQSILHQTQETQMFIPTQSSHSISNTGDADAAEIRK